MQASFFVSSRCKQKKASGKETTTTTGAAAAAKQQSASRQEAETAKQGKKPQWQLRKLLATSSMCLSFTILGR
jgi:hypothetical protein